VETNDYAEAAHLVEAVQQLSAHFQAFSQIPKIAELNGRMSTLQKALQVGRNRKPGLPTLVAMRPKP
jgi:Vps53-like, N-terminal